MTEVTGSCACGAVKYTAELPINATVYCYCTTCRKVSGAAYLPFVSLRTHQLRWESAPNEFQKSEIATRTHCAKCGSSLSMAFRDQPDTIHLALGSIDAGLEYVKPVSKCIFIKEKPAWAELPKDVDCRDTL